MRGFVLDHRRDIAAPAAVVWEVIADLPRYAEWNPFCIECRSTLKPGDPIDMVVRLRARPQRQREWIKECSEGRGFAYAMKPVPLGALSSLRRHRIEALGPERTRYDSHFELRGWLTPLVLALFRSALTQGFADMSAALQRRAETLWLQRKSAAPR